MNGQQILVTLGVDPTELTVRERHQVMVTLTAVNQGRRTVDLRLPEARLLVDGVESKAWSLAVGNGRRPATWSALRPGESVSQTWSSLGPALFPGTGRFSLVLALRDLQLAPVEVEVRPEENP